MPKPTVRVLSGKPWLWAGIKPNLALAKGLGRTLALCNHVLASSAYNIGSVIGIGRYLLVYIGYWNIGKRSYRCITSSNIVPYLGLSERS